MSAEFFTPRLRGKLARALGNNENIKHDALDNIWISFIDDLKPGYVSKVSKANQIVENIAQHETADETFLEIINDVYYTSSFADGRKTGNVEFEQLLSDLKNKSFTETEDGIQIPDARNEEGVQFVSTPQSVPSQSPTWGANWTTTSNDRTAMQAQTRDPRKVFIVYGRDTKTRDTLGRFLRHLDAWPIDWIEARKLAGKASPTTMDVVEAGLSNAQAIIVLFTPDDEARLKNDYHKSDDGVHETHVTGQARQNVILEAGMALGMARQRTILVRRGKTRDISDIAGINWIDLTDSWEDRQILVDALKHAGVAIKTDRNLNDPSIGSFVEKFPKTRIQNS